MGPSENNLRKIRIIISTLVFIPGPIILGLGITLLITGYSWIGTTLKIVAGILFVLSAMLICIKASGFHKIIHIENKNPAKSNPGTIQIGGVLAIWSLLAVVFFGFQGYIGSTSAIKDISTNLNDFIEYFKDICPW